MNTMKYILLIIIILLITPYYSFSDEYITIRVCKAVAGCPVNMDTGKCPTCINEKRKVQQVKKDSLMIRKDLYVRLQKKIRIMNDDDDYLMDCELCVGYLEKWR